MYGVKQLKKKNIGKMAWLLRLSIHTLSNTIKRMDRSVRKVE